MKKITIGIIGCGKMGSAIAKGLHDASFDDYLLKLIAYDLTPEKVTNIASDVEFVEKLELARLSDFILLAVKPYQVESILKEIDAELVREKVIISIAAGVKMQTMISMTDNRSPVVRVMPNLPASVGKGAFALALGDPLLSNNQAAIIKTLFSTLGKVVVLPEENIAAFTALVGCGPAFVYLCMEGFYQAAVTLGFSHEEAKNLTVTTFDGSSALAMNSSLSFHDLRQEVCSPKGVTIAGVNHLERCATRASITDAILEAYKLS